VRAREARLACAALVAVGLSLGIRPAAAQAPAATALDAAGELPAGVGPAEGGYLHFLGAISVGRGLRLNNPYRLATPLGDDAESVSLTATYADVALTIASGEPEGLQHGGSMHLSLALSGVPQEVLTPSYVVLHRLPPRFLAYGRAGLPVVLGPDMNLGYELAVGGAWLASAGIGATAELVFDLFYGAATQERAASAIPLLSFQLGVLVDYEVLP